MMPMDDAVQNKNLQSKVADEKDTTLKRPKAKPKKRLSTRDKAKPQRVTKKKGLVENYECDKFISDIFFKIKACGYRKTKLDISSFDSSGLRINIIASFDKSLKLCVDTNLEH